MAPLEFDPIERAGELWEERIGDATAMRLVTSLMRAQQLVLTRLEAALRPLGITFARYEVLRLLSFSRTGSLPLSRIGERLMVHPTSVTNAIDRLVAQGLVSREVDEADRRRVLASLTPEGEKVLEVATDTLVNLGFGVDALTPAQQREAYALLRVLRSADWS
ncbi:MarR family transcriptional regulator [Aeromicrobium phragmitis]|uniref:MarR family transcriptional regulator n=1 Tax=Aeromicrobium phragmitis TaxID=2478914 RepID=A0A3L8PNA5_9ACTN|nr:MarR family transcriptional regulator [Aeromicrobium phragmitis]RLV56163.1 MarR family transcriptional regulator [Aeromicrobium phragmitis]